MSVLSVVQAASPLMSITAPTSVFSSTDTYSVELAALVNESAAAISKAYDWRKLTILNTMNGNGVTTAFTLPTDYDRMPVKAAVYSSNTQLPLTPINDLDVWLDMEVRNWTDVVGRWIMLGGTFQLKPVLATGQTAKFYYLSNLYAADSGGTPKAAFTADADLFRLPERLLKLDIIWRWRMSKGLEYAEQMQNFEIAMGEEAGREKGSRAIVVGRSRITQDAVFAYPGVLGP